jgi:hypothetical protein
MLSKEALDEFKAIWREQFKEDKSDEKATEEAINLLTLMNVVYRPIRKEWKKNRVRSYL